MNAGHGRSVPSLFGELSELSGPRRLVRLAEVHAEHPELATELRALLDAEQQAGDFLGVLEHTHDARATAAAGVPAVLQPGAYIGRYRIVRELGRGGMATVWLAHDERLDRDIALKVLDDAWNADTVAAQAQFLLEAQTAAKLDDLHVVQVFDAGETPTGDLFIAMSYCSGGSLAARIARAPMPIDDALIVARQLTAALSAAHAKGIVHLDVKPANVLFDATGGVRLADFGIARLVSRHAPTSGVILGTAAYLAPEQLRGEAVDHRADLWALGVTLYEIVAGRRPFSGGSHAALLHDVLLAEPMAIDERVALPPALGMLIMSLLAKQVGDRPATAADVLATLERIHAAEREQRATMTDEHAMPLAVPLAPMVGRAMELARATELIGGARLLTLTGPGGSGKTRIAIELAQRLGAQYADGVHLVSLAALDRIDQVAAAIAVSIGLRDDGRTPELRLRRHFARAHALLVLDNFEHLMGAATLVAELLASAPRLTIMVTSRVPLRLYGERMMPVPPLGLPPASASTAQDMAGAHAVQLFVDRARAGDPAFTLSDDNAASVASICRRLDGLPLAIELAAARVRLFAPAALALRLSDRTDLLRSDARDVSMRHRSLRDVLAWSCALLDESEQALFRRLAVFVGGFTLDAAADLAGLTVDDVIDRVASLTDSNLLVRREQSNGEPRFHMLETVREYALGQLASSGEEVECRAAHRRFCLALAERAAPHLRGPAQVQWLRRLEPESGNLRAALDDAIGAGDLLLATRLAAALQRFWLVSRTFLGSTIERLELLDENIRAAELSPVTPLTHGHLLTAIGVLSNVRGAPADVPHRRFLAALERFTVADDADAIATTENHLAWSSQLLGEYAAGLRFARSAHARHEASGNEVGVATASVNIGWISLMCGAVDEADRFLGEALAIHRRREDVRACAYALSFLGTAALFRGDAQRAADLQAEALAAGAPIDDRVFTPTVRTRWIHASHLADVDVQGIELLHGDIIPRMRETGHAFSLGLGLACLGRLLTAGGALDGARLALDESLTVRRASNHPSSVAESEILLAELWLARRDATRAQAHLSHSLDTRLAIGEPLGVIECIELAARIAVEQGDGDRAMRLLTGADRARAERGLSRTARDRRIVNALRQRVHESAPSGMRAPSHPQDTVETLAALARAGTT